MMNRLYHYYILKSCYKTIARRDAAQEKTGNLKGGQTMKKILALLLALVHPELLVYSYSNDHDDVALASCCEPLPENLHIAYADEQKMSEVMANGGNIIDLRSIIK